MSENACRLSATSRHAARCNEAGRIIFEDDSHLRSVCVYCDAPLVREHEYSPWWYPVQRSATPEQEAPR